MNTNILEVKNLSVTFTVKVKQKDSFFSKSIPLYALKNISFNLKRGEVLGIVGESGCGKSTLAREIIKLNEDGSRVGEILFNGEDLLKLNKEDLNILRKDVQMIFQDPLASLDPRMTVKQIIAEPLQTFYPNLTREEVDTAIYSVMEKVGLLKSAATKYAHEFSGGQAQRIGIARALILKPKLLICDEAVSALDVSIKAQIINLLLELKAEYNMSIIFISHDLSVVKYISDRVLVLYLGKTVEEATQELLYTNPKHPYTESLFSAIPDIGIKRDRILLTGDIPSPLEVYIGCPFASRCRYVKDSCKTKDPMLESKGNLEHKVACFFPL
jgi:oligopeptide transport system ATP-binding protein